MQTARRRPTQAEIARIAGVSQATVSLVLNGSDAALSEETRQRVRSVIQSSGYAANPAARTLAGGRNRLLGIYTFEKVFPLHTGDFYFPFLLGVEEEAERRGYDLLMFTGGGEQRRIFRDGVSRVGQADGALLLGRYPDLEEVAELARTRYPFVFIGHREIPRHSIAYVAADYAAATKAVTERLLRHGHRRVAYLRLGASAGEPSQDRLSGYRDGVTAARLGSAAPMWEVQTARDAGSLLDTAMHDGVTGLVIEQLALAEEIWRACAARGLAIPGDVSVAVLGDTMDSDSASVDWSGFQVPRQEMGAAAARLLIDQLEGLAETPHSETVPCRLVEGTTISAAPGDGQPATDTRDQEQ